MNIQEWIEAGKPWNVILHGDCMELMKHFNDKEIPLCITDPPYGIGIKGQVGKNNANWTKYDKKDWDNKKPSKKYFTELFRISKNQVIFGGNYFINFLYPTKCFLIWDKIIGDNNFSMAEFIWTSFNYPSKIFKNYHGGNRVSSNREKAEKYIRIHPTQKPIALYKWILKNYAKEGDLILDTHSGSGSCAIACYQEGFDFIAIEKDIDYHRDSVARLEEVKKQGLLF